MSTVADNPVVVPELEEEKKPTTSEPRASAVFSAAGRPATKSSGSALADSNGTRSIPEKCARRASTSGNRPSAFRAPGGRPIRIGTSHDQISSGSVCPRTNPQGTGHFGTVSELRPILTLHDRHRLRWIRSAAIRPKKDNEDEDMAVIANTGKQADLESGLEKTTVQKPPHISPRDFTHWLAAKSRIDDASLQSLFKR